MPTSWSSRVGEKALSSPGSGCPEKSSCLMSPAGDFAALLPSRRGRGYGSCLDSDALEVVGVAPGHRKFSLGFKNIYI